MITVTEKMILDAAGDKGGYRHGQVQYAKAKFPKKWRKSMTGAEVSAEWWHGFVESGKKPQQRHAEAKARREKAAKPNIKHKAKPRQLSSKESNTEGLTWNPANPELGPSI